MSRQQMQIREGAGSGRENAGEGRRGHDGDDRSAPFFHELPQTVRALNALLLERETRRSDPIVLCPASGRGHDLSGFALNRLLHSYGITLRRSAFAGSPDESVAIADGIGFPVALKIISPGVNHGYGIAENLTDGNALRSTAEAIRSELSARHGESVVEGYLVQESATGVELIVGVGAGGESGPFMVVGLAGAAGAAVEELAISLLPVSADEARKMLDSLHLASLPIGAQVGKSPDVEAAAKTMASLSRFYLDHRPWLTGLEISPLIVLGEDDGVRAGNVRLAGLSDNR